MTRPVFALSAALVLFAGSARPASAAMIGVREAVASAAPLPLPGLFGTAPTATVLDPGNPPADLGRPVLFVWRTADPDARLTAVHYRLAYAPPPADAFVDRTRTTRLGLPAGADYAGLLGVR